MTDCEQHRVGVGERGPCLLIEEAGAHCELVVMQEHTREAPRAALLRREAAVAHSSQPREQTPAGRARRRRRRQQVQVAHAVCAVLPRNQQLPPGSTDPHDHHQMPVPGPAWIWRVQQGVGLWQPLNAACLQDVPCFLAGRACNNDFNAWIKLSLSPFHSF